MIDFQRKQYPLLIWQAAIGAGAALVGSALDRDYNGSLNRETREWQTAEREASQEYNTSERLASQQWQDMQRQAQNQYSEDMYNKYQSPEAMVKQYKSAGLNPAASLGDGSTGSMSVSSGSSGGAPSGTHVATPSASSPFVDALSMAGSFADIAGALKSLGEAKKLGIETEYYEDEVKAELEGKLLANEAQKLANRFAGRTMSARVKKAIVELSNGVKEGNRLDKLLDILEDEKAIKHNERQHWYDRFFREETSWAASVGESNSRTNLNEVMSNLNSISAQFEGKYKQSIINLNNSLARINKIDAEIKEATSEDEIKAINYRNKGAFEEFDAHLSELQANATNLLKEGKYKEWKMVIESISAAANAVAASKGLPIFPITTNSSSSSTSNVNSHSVNHSHIYRD